MFNYFLQSLPMTFQSKLVSDSVTTFEAAVASIRNMCCAARLAGAQAAPVRQVSSETEALRDRVKELEGQLARLQRPSRPMRQDRTCFCCGRKGHVRRDCRHRNSVCYRCGGKGHLSSVCHIESGTSQWVPATVPTVGPAQQQARGTPGVPQAVPPPAPASQLTALSRAPLPSSAPAASLALTR